MDASKEQFNAVNGRSLIEILVLLGGNDVPYFWGFDVELESTVECGCDCTGNRYVRCKRKRGAASG
jgi:hypothetical protein